MQFSRTSLLIAAVFGHGSMILPVPRNQKMTNQPTLKGNAEPITMHQTDMGCEGYACLWFNQGCTPGCDKCAGPAAGPDPSKPTCKLPESWKPHITWDQQKYITYAHVETNDVRDLHAPTPWRSPGEAPVFDSCGVAGGSVDHNDQGAGFTPPGTKRGDLGTKLPVTHMTEWTIGETAEVAFGLWANHGGGYQYRLCPADSTLDEDCFKKMPLEHVNNKQKFYWTEGPKKGQEMEIDAVRVKARDGSTWTKNPIPAYGCSYGDPENPGIVALHLKVQCTGPQFTPAIDGDAFWGFGNTNLGTGEKNGNSLPYVKDTVKVPNVKPGHYVLSWRWDCEQTPQIWNSCADINISAKGVHV